MAKQIYTLRENEKELFVLKAKSIFIGGSSHSFWASVKASARAVLRSLPIIGCCCGKGEVSIIVTDQRIIIVDRDVCWCCHEEDSVIALSSKCLDGYNSFDYKRHNLLLCCCAVKSFRFSIGIQRGAVSSSIIFETDTVKTPQEASAVLAKFDELLK